MANADINVDNQHFNNLTDAQPTGMDVDQNETRSKADRNNSNSESTDLMDLEENDEKINANRYKFYLNSNAVMVPFVDYPEEDEEDAEYDKSSTAEDQQYEEHEEYEHSKNINQIRSYSSQRTNLTTKNTILIRILKVAFISKNDTLENGCYKLETKKQSYGAHPS